MTQFESNWKKKQIDRDGQREPRAPRESVPDANNHLQRCQMIPLPFRVSHICFHTGWNKASRNNQKTEIGNDSMRAEDRKTNTRTRRREADGQTENSQKA